MATVTAAARNSMRRLVAERQVLHRQVLRRQYCSESGSPLKPDNKPKNDDPMGNYPTFFIIGFIWTGYIMSR